MVAFLVWFFGACLFGWLAFAFALPRVGYVWAEITLVPMAVVIWTVIYSTLFLPVVPTVIRVSGYPEILTVEGDKGTKGIRVITMGLDDPYEYTVQSSKNVYFDQPVGVRTAVSYHKVFTGWGRTFMWPASSWASWDVVHLSQSDEALVYKQSQPH